MSPEAAIVPEDGGFSRGVCEPFFVAVEHPEGPRPWPPQYGPPVVEFAVMDRAPSFFRPEEALSPFTENYRRVRLERREVYAERCLIGWAFVEKGHDPVAVLARAYGGEFLKFNRELAYEALVVEPRRHEHLLATLGLRP